MFEYVKNMSKSVMMINSHYFVYKQLLHQYYFTIIIHMSDIVINKLYFRDELS